MNIKVKTIRNKKVITLLIQDISILLSVAFIHLS